MVLLLLGCGSGRYGYAREYSFLPDEESHARHANQDAVYDEVRRMPDHFNGQVITWFGVVTSVRNTGGAARVAMDVRTHQTRHLCEDETEASCRVTVSEQSGGPFTAVLQLHPEDVTGEHRLQAGSLVRVYGTVVPGEYDDNGGPVLRAQYYRHWPRGQYVTTADANAMRR
jgi:hypothetical protein